LVATTRSLKYNGGGSLEGGLVNLLGHIENLVGVFGAEVVVAINKFATDTDAELALIKAAAFAAGAKCECSDGWAKGGAGCTELARTVAEVVRANTKNIALAYETADDIAVKIEKIATRVYGAAKVAYSDKALAQIAEIRKGKAASYPVCIAKTQYSFSQDPKLLGRPKGFEFFVRELEVRGGAGFIVAVAGDMLLMPGLPKVPAAVGMTIDDNLQIKGLF
jgi:formate--tetrahydrofolate ligase